jgi:serine acetyltransferase
MPWSCSPSQTIVLCWRRIPLLAGSRIGAEIGAGTKFGYGGIGVVVHDDCVIGRGYTISQRVTLGGAMARPRPGARGQLMVGVRAKGARAGPPRRRNRGRGNAVATHVVPPGTTVVGIPARPWQYGEGVPSAIG